MRAVRCTGGSVAVIDVPEPEGDGVVVEVRSAAICGSDLHLAGMGLAVTLGHEFAGSLPDGTAVAVQPVVPCGSCDQCLDGQQQLCRTAIRRIYGVSLNGGLAERVLVDPGCVVPLPEGVDVSVASLIEPLGVAVHALHQAAVESGQQVLVVGGGSIGLLAAAAAQFMGASVDMVARHPRQQQAAEALDVGQSFADEYDVVVDAAGTQSSLDTAVQQVRPGGTIAMVATWWSPVQVSLALLSKEARLVPGYMYGHHEGRREMATAVDVLAARPSIAGAVITHRLALEEAAEAFDVAGNRQAGAIKVVLEP